MPRVCRLVLALGGAALLSVSDAAASVGQMEKVADGVLVAAAGVTLKIEVCTDDVVRVAYAPDRAFFGRPSLVTAPKQCGGATWDVHTTANAVIIQTARLRVRVNGSTLRVSFANAAGVPIVSEAGRSLSPAEVQGERTFNVRQQWTANADESLYGLGQQQLGLMNIKGYDLDLWQHNVSDVVPVLVSSRGYGILWENMSFSRFGDLRRPEPMPAAALIDETGKPGGLTGHYFAGAHFEREVGTRVDSVIDIHVAGQSAQNARIHPALPADGDASVRWAGSVVPAVAGDYTFHAFSNAGLKVWVDGRLVVDHWRQGWLPWNDVARVSMVTGRRYKLVVEWSKDQGDTCQVRWKTPPASTDTSLWSEVGDGIDYYFLYGPELDAVVAGYRRVTGQAPMMPRWAFGLWQSRERYKTQQESLDVLDGFRSRHIPIDVMVQDWQYWKIDSWGSHAFDKERFPNPDAWIRQMHDKHAKLMISVWGKFYPGTANFDALHAAGYLYEGPLKDHLKDWLGYPYTFYDPFSAGARTMFWNQVKPALFDKGVDAWWMDATEPDLVQPLETLDGQRTYANPTGMGTGARVLNGYPLVNSLGIYEGQRAAAPDQRVFILTRSAFAGLQRYATAMWSGDVSTTWTALRKQIPAGLGFSLSGVPYWATDTGGFDTPPRFARVPQAPDDADEWKEMNVRWFQYSTFTPLLRVHGQSPNREMWFLGGDSDPAYQAELKFDRLRYRLLPYVYSLAGAVTHEAGTILRPLVMDFRSDAVARDIGDQYMFGPAFLVSPVTIYKARSRTVYLPKGTSWYDAWTGQSLGGGETTSAPAPYDTLPIHVRAGSIVPLGPELEYTDEKPADPLTLYVYAGANGAFSLYEDDGATYGYEKGAFTRIPLAWNDRTRVLTIGARAGAFPGMLQSRTFKVVLVSSETAVASGAEPPAARLVTYTGISTTVDLSATPAIKVDQVGYLTDAPKIAMVASDQAAGPFAVLRVADGQVVFHGTLGAPSDDPDSGDHVRAADFSPLTTPGTYLLEAEGVGRSWPFEVGPDVYRRAYYLAARSYYGQRCGTAVDLGPEFPGYSHAACHLVGAYHPSSGKSGPHPSAGGWHDAGDYGRYVVNSGIATGSLLLADELFARKVESVSLRIPESSNKAPDLLDEARWNLDWMLSMQDEDGGVWQKQTSEHFPGFVVPEADSSVSYVIGTGSEPFKSSCATADLAAVAAIASRRFREFDSAYANRTLVAARKAWDWLDRNPNVVFHNPPGISTGEYGDGNCADERLWAAAELWSTTGTAVFDQYFLAHYGEFQKAPASAGPASWGNVAPLALWSYALSVGGNAEAIAAIRADVLAAADAIVARSTANPYRISLTTSDYVWGSNAVAANYAMQLLVANRLHADRKYVDSALDDLHYLLGRNALSLSFVTQVGANAAKHPHHRPSGADANDLPWPGLLTGGPNGHRQDQAMQKLTDRPPARMYLDELASYATNEVAINWNAPLVFVLASTLQAGSMR